MKWITPVGSYRSGTMQQLLGVELRVSLLGATGAYLQKNCILFVTGFTTVSNTVNLSLLQEGGNFLHKFFEIMRV